MKFIKYFICAAVCAAISVITYFIGNKYKILYNPLKKSCGSDESVNAFSAKATIALQCVFAAADFFLILNIKNHTDTFISLFKLVLILTLLQSLALIDIKLKIIPNLLLGICLAVRLVLYIAEFILSRNGFIAIIKSDLIGFAFGFCLLLIISLITKQSIGFGDVKLFGIIGITLGMTCTFMTLFSASVISAVYGIALMIIKKKSGKTSMPFAPFIYLGYVVCLILSVY